MILNIPPTLSQIRAGNLRVPLQFNADLTSQYDSAKTQILSNGTSGVNLLLGVSTSGFILLKSGITNLFAAGSAQGVQNQNSWGVGVYGCNVGGSSYSGFSSTGLSDILGNVPTGSSYKLFVQGVEKYRLGAALCELDRISLGGVIGSSTDPGAGSLALTNRVQFAGAGTADSTKSLIYADGANGNLLINVPSARYFELLVAGFTSYTFGYSANLATTGANVFQIGDGSGSYIQSDGFGLLHRVSNTYAHTFKVNTTDVGYFDGSGLTVTKNIVSSNNSNAGDRTTNLDVQRYFNNIFWGWPASAYTCSVGAFNGSGYPFICFYGYHSSTTNTIKRSSATNQPVWLQSLGGYLSIWQGSSGTADTDCTSTEKYRFSAALAEFDRLSLGGTIGSSVDPGAGGINASGNITSSNNSNVGGRVANFSAQRYFNNYFWGYPSSAYTCSIGSFNGSGYPFICFYGYHSTTTNTIARASATNAPVWMQSSGGAIEFFTGSSGTADGDCTGTSQVKIDSTGLLTGKLYISTAQTPASNDTGTTGQIAWDANYIYVCTATNTWKRAALTGGY